MAGQYAITTPAGRIIGGPDGAFASYADAERWGRRELGGRGLWGWGVRHLPHLDSGDLDVIVASGLPV